MSDGERLLRAILEEPGDDARRLVYADWLEEQGQDARAEFVRVQMEFAGLICRQPGAKKGDYCNDTLCRHCSLEHRAVVLEGGAAWNPEWAANAARFHGLPDGFRKAVIEGAESSYEVRRGFVTSVRCPLAAWLEHAEAICRAHPVERVEISDREPHQWASGWGYWLRPWGTAEAAVAVRYAHWLPNALRPALSARSISEDSGDECAMEWDTREEALAALSRAAVNLGRERAGLPPLEAASAPGGKP